MIEENLPLTIIQAGESPHACPAIAGKKPPTGDLIGGFCLPGSRRGGRKRCRARVGFRLKGTFALGGKVQALNLVSGLRPWAEF